MKKHLITLFTVYTSFVQAQNLSWSTPVALTTSIGHVGGQITISKNTPVISVGDDIVGDLYVTRFVGGAFTAPIKLNPIGFTPGISTANGPKLAAQNDTIYITYLNELETDIYLQHSFDGGLTFGDTIRVVDMQTNIPQYPSIAIMNDGNPVISFASLKSNFTDPQYFVTKSFNAGTNFTTPVSVTGSLGADPCDCCAGSIALHDNKVAVIYRNSGNNLRDMRAAISTDTASSFNTLGEIDNNNWIVAACPISGGQGVILGDTLISCFMNGIFGTTTFLSTLNVNTNVMGFERPIFAQSGVGAQELSSIAGSGDTVGIVWTQQVGSSRKILFSYSTHGAFELGMKIDTVTNLLPNSVYTNPELAFANGIFYLIFNDNFASNLLYTQASVSSATAIQEQTKNDFTMQFANGANALSIKCNETINNAVTITISNTNGSVIEKISLPNLQTNQLINLKNQLSSGLYLVALSSKDYSFSQKLFQN